MKELKKWPKYSSFSVALQFIKIIIGLVFHILKLNLCRRVLRIEELYSDLKLVYDSYVRCTLYTQVLIICAIL